MHLFFDRLSAASPLFVLILAGYVMARWGNWPKAVSSALSRLVFSVALPALLFYTLSDFSHLPPVDARLLIAFFGGALLIFVFGRWLAFRAFGLDGVSASIFALGCIFSNNAMLGLPLAKATLGDAALPAVALVLAFNSLILWTLVTVSVEWARNGELSAKGFMRTAYSVVTNPLVAAIICGFVWGLTGWPLPHLVGEPVRMLGEAATPLSLLVLGMGLAEYAVSEGVKVSLTMSVCKLLVLPLVVWAIAWGLGLPTLETQVVVLLSSMAMGVNVYLMSLQFQALQGATAAGLVLSTVLAAVTTPVVLALIGLVG